MIREFLPNNIFSSAASALSLLVCLTAQANAQDKVRRNTSIDQFLERDAAADNEATTHRLRQGASGVGLRDKAAMPETKPGSTMQRLPAGQWIEGPGFDVTYGLTYEACAAKCVSTQQCVMIEFYRPEKKCNLYSSKRPTKKGGSSDIAVRG